MDFDPKDVVYTNGEVLVACSASPAQAIYIQNGRIVSIGPNDDVLNAAGAGIPRINLKGAVVIPGLIDTHPHLLHFAAFEASQLDISKAENHFKILNAIHKRSGETLR
ncbi:hypothetical protein BDV19DRAFT_389075 [Aspergillus venezuelensis]